MATIQSITRFTIRPGKLEEFKRLAAECLQLVRDNDTGTLRYAMFFNSDETECVLYGEYADFEASAQHFKNMGEAGKAVHKITDVQAEMWGNPGPELTRTIQAHGCAVFLPFLSLSK